MVIRPHGYALWENMQRVLDGMFKATGHQNAYFPLFIPKSFLAKEAQHVEGFAKECAIVTHSRLMAVEVDGKTTLVPDPASKLEEELIIRPTSETIIYSMFAKWVQRTGTSHAHQPVGQRRPLGERTRLFLRTRSSSGRRGTRRTRPPRRPRRRPGGCSTSTRLRRRHMAVPVLRGLKTEKEKFAGAAPHVLHRGADAGRKALQAGTSHHLGQNFAKAFDLKFQTESGSGSIAFNTSWGVSTRLVGAVVMAHGDDNGLVLPPRLAPIQVVIVPIWKGNDPVDRILAAARETEDLLKKAGVLVKLDARDNLSPGFKFNEWEMLGVPLRIEIGPKDLDKGSVCCVRRPNRAKSFVPMAEVAAAVPRLLEDIQAEMLAAAKARRDASTFTVDTYDEFKAKLENPGGFLLAHWCGDTACEAAIHEETKATVRVLVFDAPEETGPCIRCNGTSKRRVHFAKAY